jgi:IclR family transcriptional regulator, pca regulon regulatory protein
MSTGERDEGEFVRALARGLQVIECFEGERWPISLSEVARRTNLARGSARRLLLTLQQLGYVDSVDGRFFLRARTLRLGHAYLTSSPLGGSAEDVLRALADQVDESCSLSELDGDEIVYLARVTSRRLIRDYIEIGRRMPAYPTSMGRVLLSGLPDEAFERYLARVEMRPLTARTTTDRDALRRIVQDARVRGWSVSDEEIEMGRRAIAVPVRSRGGRIIAALNVSAASARYSCDEMAAKFLSLMREAADELARTMAWSSDRLR